MGISEGNISSFVRRHLIIIVSVLLSLFSLHLALTARTAVRRGYITREILSAALTPVQRLVEAGRDGVKGVWSDYIALTGVRGENESLKRDLEALRNENNTLKEALALNARIKELLAYKDRAPFRTVGASILGYSSDRWTRTAMINKGRVDGVRRDLAVISPLGVVGRIIEVSRSTSRVLLETDLRSNIDVIVQRTRINGVAEGNGNDALRIKYVRLIDDVRVGDRVLSSGYTGIFPKGLPVGVVTRVARGEDNFFKQIELSPAVEMDRLEDVLVVMDSALGVDE